MQAQTVVRLLLLLKMFRKIRFHNYNKTNMKQIQSKFKQQSARYCEFHPIIDSQLLSFFNRNQYLLKILYCVK